jgi:Na+/H+ antiporter NhaD/arsenite permease-like protein
MQKNVKIDALQFSRVGFVVMTPVVIVGALSVFLISIIK